MSIRRSSWLLAGSALLALATLSCKDAISPPPGAASVEVTSAIDTILPMGRTSQLTATARDQAGAAIPGATFTWSTSDPAVVGVSSAGLATPGNPGTATVTATTQGQAPRGGNIRLRVVEADLATVIALGGDAFAAALVGAVSSGQRAAVQAAWSACATGATAGNVVTILGCLAQVRAAAGSVSDPTDRALLAVALLYVDQIERQLGL